MAWSRTGFSMSGRNGGQKQRTGRSSRRSVRLIQQKLDRLDDAFLFQQSIDAKTYERQRDRAAAFFPEGIRYDENRFNRTAATAPLFSYLAPSETARESW